MDALDPSATAPSRFPPARGVASQAPGRARPGRDDAPRALRANLRQLLILRTIAIGGQAAAIVVSRQLGVDLPLPEMALAVAALVLWNGAVLLRLRSPRDATAGEIALNVAVDVTEFTALLHLAGGAGNPFSLLYVLHCAMMALLLSPRAAAGGVALVVAGYVVLGKVYQPLLTASGAPVGEGLLDLGRWVSFGLTGGCTAWFIARVMRALREHDRCLGEAVQRALRDDAVLRIGAVAAGAAHDLARPLGNAAVLADEIVSTAATPATRRDARLLAAQLALCRSVLDEFAAAAGHARAAGGGRQRVDRFLESIAATCRMLHPDATILSDWTGIARPPDILGEHGLRQALLTLLNNAVDASPAHVRFAGALDGDRLRLSIVDHGPGMSPDDVARLGKAFFTTKPPGRGAGLGLVIAARTIERLRGSLRWRSAPNEGTRVEVELPLDELRVGALHDDAS